MSVSDTDIYICQWHITLKLLVTDKLKLFVTDRTGTDPQQELSLFVIK